MQYNIGLMRTYSRRISAGWRVRSAICSAHVCRVFTRRWQAPLKSDWIRPVVSGCRWDQLTLSFDSGRLTIGRTIKLYNSSPLCIVTVTAYLSFSQQQSLWFQFKIFQTFFIFLRKWTGIFRFSCYSSFAAITLHCPLQNRSASQLR